MYWWKTAALAGHYAGMDAAMDWLVRRKNRIQGKLARRLLSNGL